MDLYFFKELDSDLCYSPTRNLHPFRDREFSFAVKLFQNKERLFFFSPYQTESMGTSVTSINSGSSVCESLSCVPLFETPWTVALKAPLSMEFSRQAHWSG